MNKKETINRNAESFCGVQVFLLLHEYHETEFHRQVGLPVAMLPSLWKQKIMLGDNNLLTREALKK